MADADHPLINELKRYSAEPDLEWGKVKSDFAMGAPDQRVAQLLKYDRHWDEKGVRPTRADAQLMQQRRELKGIHEILLRAGR